MASPIGALQGVGVPAGGHASFPEHIGRFGSTRAANLRTGGNTGANIGACSGAAAATHFGGCLWAGLYTRRSRPSLLAADRARVHPHTALHACFR